MPVERFVAQCEKRLMLYFKYVCTKNNLPSTEAISYLCQYVIEISKTDLRPLLAVVESWRSNKKLLSIESNGLVETAISCLYACERNDQFDIGVKIINSLPPGVSSDLDSISKLWKGLKALQSYGIALTPTEFHSTINNEEESVKLIKRMVRRLTKKKLRFD